MLTSRLPFLALPLLLLAAPAYSQEKDDLVIVDRGAAKATIVVSAKAGKWEKHAADDLAKYIGIMSGAKVPVGAEAKADGAAIYVGEAALQAAPDLKTKLAGVAKKNPYLRADA